MTLYYDEYDNIMNVTFNLCVCVFVCVCVFCLFVSEGFVAQKACCY